MRRNRRRWLFWLGALTLCAPVFSSTYAFAQGSSQEPRNLLYYRVKPAVVFITFTATATIKVGNQVWSASTGGSGSGWLISPDGYVVTNGHVVELYHEDNQELLRAQLYFQALEENYFPRLRRPLSREQKMRYFDTHYVARNVTLKRELTVYTQNWKRYDAEVKEYSPPISERPGKVSIPGYEIRPGKDVAILKIEGRDLPTLRIGDSNQVDLGQRIHVAGYPGVVLDHPYLNLDTALEATFTEGQVSSLKATLLGADVLQIDAAVAPGNSGGPVFNDQGEVIGMATFASIEQSGGGSQREQGFNFAVSVSTIREFIRSAGINLEQESLFDRTWSEALQAYRASDWDTAKDKLDDVLKLMPNLSDAKRLQETAIRRGGNPPDSPVGGGGDTTGGVDPWMWVVMGVIGLGLVLVIAGVRWSRDRRVSKPIAIQTGLAPSATAPPPALPSGAISGQLVVREGPLAGNRFPIRAEGMKIGRDSDTCQMVISEPNVSREHALVRSDGKDSEVLIRNLSGTNPTYVNDRAIQETTLKPGDKIRIGSSVIIYEA